MLIPRRTRAPDLGAPIAITFLPVAQGVAGPSRPIAIEQDLPLSHRPGHGPYGRDLDQETGGILHGGEGGDGHVVALPFRTAPEIRRLAFLKLDPTFRSARWQGSAGRQAPTMLGRLGRMFGGASPPSPALDDLVALHGGDYPVHPGFAAAPPWPLQVCTDGRRTTVFSRGAKDSTKHGAFCAVLAEIGEDGRITRPIYLEDHTASSRKHARKGLFVDGGRAFIMHSEYKATDPWNGGWALVRLADGDVTVLRPPRGFDDLEVLDVAGNAGWFRHSDAEGLKLSRLSW